MCLKGRFQVTSESYEQRYLLKLQAGFPFNVGWLVGTGLGSESLLESPQQPERSPSRCRVGEMDQTVPGIDKDASKMDGALAVPERGI